MISAAIWQSQTLGGPRAYLRVEHMLNTWGQRHNRRYVIYR